MLMHMRRLDFCAVRLLLVASLALSGISLLGCQVVSVRPAGSSASAMARVGPEVREVPVQDAGARDEGPRRRLIVLPFLSSTTLATNKTAAVVREAFMRSLKRTDQFVFVAPTDLPRDPSLYVRGQEYELETLGKLAGALGVAAVLEGRILDLRAKRVGDQVGVVRQLRARMDATIQIRLVSVKNGNVVLNETRSASIEEITTRVAERPGQEDSLTDDPVLVEAAIAKAFQSVIPKLSSNIDKLSWEGRVAMVKGDRIYINSGRVSGLQIGDILKVTEEGEDVYDPETGTLIGRIPGRLKGTVEIVSYFGRDGSIGVIHSGSGFRESDRVELY
jgi:curli biogenesis system outer membrane secretion channel CsgG